MWQREKNPEKHHSEHHGRSSNAPFRVWNVFINYVFLYQNYGVVFLKKKQKKKLQHFAKMAQASSSKEATSSIWNLRWEYF